MLEKHQLKILSDAVRDAWKNVNIVKMNGLDTRLRVVTDRAANFHTHADSDELICCRTTTLKPLELAVVPRNTSYRLRVEGRAVMFVIDAIKG